MITTQIQTFSVHGLGVRTRNVDEAQLGTARIGQLWRDFGDQLSPHMPQGATVYAVYHRYASDANGEYEVLVGTDGWTLVTVCPQLMRLDIGSGQYLVFEATGPTPQAVFAAWDEIWRYFADQHCPHQRAFRTDFERYQPDGQVAIFVSVRQP